MKPERVAELMEREQRRFEETHPRSREIHERAQETLLSGVPMNWMTRWPGAYPIFIEGAAGATVTDVDGHDYVDLCLGDTGAMTGHSPPATVAAASEQMARGITTMLPTEDALAVAGLMRERFGLAHWQFTLSATDANRFVVRLAREITGRAGSWSSTTATTAASTRRSSRSAPTAPRPPGMAASGPRSTRPRPRGWSSSTTSTPSRPRSPQGTWPACSPSRL